MKNTVIQIERSNIMDEKDIVLSPECEEELSNGKGEDDNEEV